MCNRPGATVQIAFLCEEERQFLHSHTHAFTHKQAKRMCLQPLHIYPKAEHFFYIFFVHFYVVFEVDDFDFVMAVNVYEFDEFCFNFR